MCMITPLHLCVEPLSTRRSLLNLLMAFIINMQWGNPIWVWHSYLTLIFVCICLACSVELKGTVSNVVVVNLYQFQPFLGLSYMLCVQRSKNPH